MSRRIFIVGGLAAAFALTPAVALAHEGQVIRLGSFLAGLTHPVLGLDHFLAMVSVGVVSALIGGRAIWTVPVTFVLMMGVGGLIGRQDIGLGSTVIEIGIAVSVVLLGIVIAADQQLKVQVAMGAVAFFGFFHGYAHGLEIPNIARPGVYAAGFMTGTALLHIAGLVLGDVGRRYRFGRPALRVSGAAVSMVGGLFIVGVL